MNNSNPNKTDDFFRQALSSAPDLSPDEKDWEDMERLLKAKPNKKPVIARLYWPIGIAAGMLIFFSVWLSLEPKPPLVINKNSKSQTNESNKKKIISDQNPVKETESINKKLAKNIQTKIKDLNQNTLISSTLEKKTLLSNTVESLQKTDIIVRQAEKTNLSYAKNQAVSFSASFPSKHTLPINSLLLTPEEKINVQRFPADWEESLRQARGKWSMSMAFSSDMNSVKGINNAKAGLSLGLGLNYSISKSISASTGIFYSQKKYTSDKNSYRTLKKPFALWASYSRQIDADCKVLDIPLNFNVLLKKTEKTGIIAFAGLSSYFMLSEKYNFIYNANPAYPTSGRQYAIKNSNQHVLSVFNLGIGLEKPLSKQSSIVIQPYAKLPISGIGQGETDLKSFGIGFQLNYSLKKKNKMFGRKSE